VESRVHMVNSKADEDVKVFSMCRHGTSTFLLCSYPAAQQGVGLLTSHLHSSHHRQDSFSRVRLSVPFLLLSAASLVKYYTVVRSARQARFSANATANTAPAKQENRCPPLPTAFLPRNQPTINVSRLIHPSRLCETETPTLDRIFSCTLWIRSFSWSV